MALGQKRNRPLVLDAARNLNQFKYEVANELGVQVPQSDYWGDMPSRVTGAVGGHMVRRMIAAAEQALIEQATSGVKAGFQQALQNPLTVQNPAQPAQTNNR
ncbi:MAG: alpha/beta-type small acid-soluble spore protein [Limnochordaceae bacterium]|uniref:Alpha/beta-type small acid-soluble spore protein n=1 Tax=Carboxydichorda subterranea TaxID=3109565 RepID=A0ABZ1BWH3_9FIRM|nr:alpha/beta-type small acid-soluble spore protein [Limnochorda sp. L945t]MBE3599543.1 alpha/beta-type small acid-soluble spore protein [Limnochordaceae bacterium]WRP17018.1 alpha/beta-type small acid-soluble spore protein [Limnochorda sp. L945t]